MSLLACRFFTRSRVSVTVALICMRKCVVRISAARCTPLGGYYDFIWHVFTSYLLDRFEDKVVFDLSGILDIEAQHGTSNCQGKARNINHASYSKKRSRHGRVCSQAACRSSALLYSVLSLLNFLN